MTKDCLDFSLTFTEKEWIIILRGLDAIGKGEVFNKVPWPDRQISFWVKEEIKRRIGLSLEEKIEE